MWPFTFLALTGPVTWRNPKFLNAHGLILSAPVYHKARLFIARRSCMPHVGRRSTTLCLARLSRLCLDDISAIGLSRVQRAHHFCAQSERTPTTFGVHGSLFTPSARKQASTMADEYALLAKIPSAERHRWVAHEHRRRVARGSLQEAACDYSRRRSARASFGSGSTRAASSNARASMRCSSPYKSGRADPTMQTPPLVDV